MKPSTDTFEIQVNGTPHPVSVGQTLPALLTTLGQPPQTALVEHNGRALLRSEWEQVVLAAGDRLEILRVVAGG